eukprot:gene68428-93770_t
MLIAVILLAASLLPSGYIAAYSQHPQVLAVKVWALAHLLVNGETAQVILFAAFLAWGVILRISYKRRARAGGSTDRVYKSWTYDIVAVVAGAIVYGLIVWKLHLWVIGVPVIRVATEHAMTMINDNDSFIREVNEELRSEQIRTAWKRFAPLIIGVAVLIVVGVAGSSLYQWWQTSQSS